MYYERAMGWLVRAKNSEGWGYLSGGTPRLEPTLYVTALGVSDALPWLERTLSGWEMLLAPAALSATPKTDALRTRLLDEVAALRGNVVEKTDNLDGSIVGWPWVPNTFAWLEPTAFAVISMLRNGLADHERVGIGRQLIRDRVCADGGWNYGNRELFGAQLISYHHSTAWALLALPKGDTLVADGLARLHQILDAPSTLSLAMASIAAAYHGRDPSPWLNTLKRRQNDDGRFGGGRVDRTALAAIALSMESKRFTAFTGDVGWDGGGDER